MSETTQFPTEIVSLPSKGKLYKEDSPLASGELEIRYPRAKEEDILTSANLIQKGVVIEKFLESLIVDKSVVTDDLLIGDKNAVMLAARILAYGKEYPVETACTTCGEAAENVMDLTTIDEKEVEASVFENGNSFEFLLPVCKRVITYRFLTQKDEADLELEVAALTKYAKGDSVSPELTSRIKKMITSIDGDTSTVAINNFVDKEMLSRDSLAFRTEVAKRMPDVDMSYDFECDFCGHEEKATVPMTVHFFWPATRI